MAAWLGLSLPTAPAASAVPATPLDIAPTGSILGLRAPEVDQAMLGTLAEPPAPQITPPPATMPYYSPTQKKFSIGGRLIDEDDAASLLEAEALLDRPDTGRRPAGDFQPIGRSGFNQILEPIKNPSLGTLFARGVSRGIDTSQLLIGRGLQLAGAEQFGGRIVAQQMEDLRREMPYSRQFTDIQDPGDALEWFVAGFGEQVPNLLESIAVAGAGAVGGTFTGGPGVGTAAGALAGLAGKSAFKQQVLAAARKKAAGEVLDEAETKILRSAGALVGVTAATFANSYRTGAADIYGELREQGADPDDISSKMLALAGAFPYALAESATEYLLAGRAVGMFTGPRAIPAGTKPLRRGAELLRRGAVGGAVGGVAEGGTELAQESLLLGLSDQDFSKPENIERLINSFAAGAAIGAPIGGIVNLRGTKPTSLLGGEADVLALPAPPKQLTDQRAGAVPAVTPFPQLTGPGNVPLLTGPNVIYGEAPAETLLLPSPPPVGTQGELNLIGGRGVAPAVAPPPTAVAPAPSTEIQDVLPFESGLAPRYFAPTGPVAASGALADNPVLRAIQQRQQEQLAAQQQAQMAAQRQAEFEQAQAARTAVPEISALDQRLAESQPFLEVVGTEGTLLPEPTYGTTPAQAAEEWRALAGRGRPKPFASFLPEIQNQWIDALNMAQAGELTVDDLRTIRNELVAAENAARLTKSAPRTVVTGDITPTPTPPKGGKARALKKPKATAVAPSKPTGTRGETLKRPAARAVAEPTGKPAAKPAVKAEVKAAPVPKGQGEAVQDVAKAPAKPKAVVPPGQARGEMTDAARIDDAITFVEEATTRADRDDVRDAYYDILELAFFERLSSGTVEGRKAIQTKARDFLKGPISKWHQPSLAKAFRDIMLREDTLPADGPWLQFMMDNDLTDAFPAKAKAKVTNVSKIKDDALRAQAEEMFVVEEQPAVTTQATYQSRFVSVEAPLQKLASLLTSMPKVMSLDRPFVFRQEQYENLPFALEDLFAEVNEADRNALVNGYPLKDYFTKDGEAKFETTPSGLNTPTAKKDGGRFALAAFNQPDRADPAMGKLRMAVTRFVSKLATKPKVTVFKNQADMKAKNPALYRKAVAARPEGDFDTALAAGYSFGDGNVVIFTDRIANEQHLNFVLAHETLGHFGLRGIIPAKQFDAVMEAIYKASPAIRSDVDIAMADRDQSRSEAVEEYLSDFAGVLDTSVVARIWNAIKNALNKLGIKFGDEMVRYILKQSRSYVRSGKSSMFDAAKVFTDLQDVEYGKGYASTGRFSLTGDLRDDNRVAVEIVRERTGFGQYKDPGVAWGEVKGQFGNAADFFDKFKQFFLSLANFRSLENLGLYRYNEIVKKGQDIISFLRVSSNESNAEILDASDDVKAKTSKLLYAGLDFAISKITDVRTLKGAPLFSYVDGVLKPNQPEIDKLTKQGMLEFSQAKNGVTYEVIGPDGEPRTEKFAGIPDLTEDSLEWKGYLSLRETVNQLALRLLAVKYENATATQNFALKRFSAYTEEGSGLTQQDALMFRRIVTRYSELKGEDMTLDDRGYPMMAKDAMDRAEKLLEFTNKSILSKGKASDLEQVAAAFKGAIADDVVAQLRDFAKRAKLNEQNKFAIQDELRRLGGLAFGASAADTNTRRTLATGYTPLLRPGSWQIRMEGVDAEGNPVVISDAYRSNILYMHVGTQSEAVKTETKLNDIFKDTAYEVEVYDANSGDYVKKKVKLRAKAEVSLDAVTGPTYINYSEFLYGIEQLGIRLTPAEMERVTIAMTKQTSPARKRGLQRERVPGADDDGVTAVSNYVDKTANTIGKESMRPELSDLMNLSLGSSRALWDSNPILDSGARELDVLKAAAAIPSPDGRPTVAQKEYARLKYMYEKTNPKGKPKRANQYYNEAARAAALLDGSQNVSESDFESGAVASQIRAYTSLVQLGGSIATGALNLITPYTNTIPFLASYNPATGFGGGFGAGPAVREFHRAMRHVGVRGATGGTAFNTATFYDAVAKSKDLQIKYGLAAHEADFIAREIREGVMIPAQSNALLNTARGRSTSRFWRKFSDLWMTPFNVTEQATRRAAGLAAYRLEYERQIANGKSEAKAKDAARRFAVEAIDLTMGDYAVNNRPPAFRSGIQTFLYMYKVYPTVVIQLYSNLSRNGKLGMLLGLFILSGLQGLPFAEDLEDLIDTLAQALGFKSGSIRMEIAQAVDSIFPGMSPYFLQGMVNSWMPADIAGRVSVGNVLPGTEILLPRADVGRQLVDIAGPAPSALIGSAKFFADLMRAPFSDRIQLVDVAREAPVTMLRASGDAVAYAKSDAIVDRKGYVVADDANAAVIATRLLGFYPSAAAQQYSAIRIARRIDNYQKDVVAGFRQAWIKAKMEGDEERARDIVRSVEQWNEGAKGTGLEIGNFVKNSQTALKQAKMPAGERTLKALPKAGRADVEEAFDLLTY